MRLSRVLIGVVLMTLAISLVSIWFYPSYRDFTSSNSTWNGMKDFSVRFGADVLDSLDDLPLLPGGATLIEIPYIDYVEDELRWLRNFVENGGNLILLDDYAYGNRVLEYLGLEPRFSNRPLLDPLFAYKNQQFPKVIDLSPRLKGNGVEVILLNHATALTSVDESQVLAWSSSTSFLDENENGAHEDYESQGPFPVVAQLRMGEGRIALVADPSVIINSMVSLDDNYALMAYLIGGGEEGKGTLLIDRSHITRAPLEVSKTGLVKAKDVLSGRYALLGVVAAIFVVVGAYTLKREDILDKR